MPAQRVSGDFGGMLRRARERRGLSLREISNATKIAMMTLEALERNDITRLPGGIFSRAFVRAYAMEVGLDPETVIEEFMGQFPQDSVTAGHPTSSQIEDYEAVESDRRMASTFLRLIVIAIPIAAVVVYFGTSGRKIVGGWPSDVVSPVAAPTAEPARQVPPGPETPADRLMVQVSATRTAWISAIVDGRRAAQREFNPGDEATFEVHSEIILTAGDAGGVAVRFNGLPARPLGGSGQVVTLRVDLTNFKSYLVTP